MQPSQQTHARLLGLTGQAGSNMDCLRLISLDCLRRISRFMEQAGANTEATSLISRASADLVSQAANPIEANELIVKSAQGALTTAVKDDSVFFEGLGQTKNAIAIADQARAACKDKDYYSFFHVELGKNDAENFLGNLQQIDPASFQVVQKRLASLKQNLGALSEISSKTAEITAYTCVFGNTKLSDLMRAVVGLSVERAASQAPAKSAPKVKL